MTTSGSTSFNVTPSETQDFYQGLLEPVEPQTLALFKEQGVADEILFYLFTQQVIEERQGEARQIQFVNDRLDPSFEGFHHYVELAMRYGLSAEPTPGAKPGKSAKADKSAPTSRAATIRRASRARIGGSVSTARPGRRTRRTPTTIRCAARTRR